MLSVRPPHLNQESHIDPPGPGRLGGHYIMHRVRTYVLPSQKTKTGCSVETITRLESCNDPRPSTNQNTSCTDGRTDTITRNNEPLFKLVLWFFLGRGTNTLTQFTRLVFYVLTFFLIFSPRCAGLLQGRLWERGRPLRGHRGHPTRGWWSEERIQCQVGSHMPMNFKWILAQILWFLRVLFFWTWMENECQKTFINYQVFNRESFLVIFS